MNKALDINDIKKIIPHRYPFLLVDKLLEVEPRKRAVGLKNVTINEEFFQGHYPESPVMPGVLIIEAMAQVSGLAVLTDDEVKGMVPYFAGIDKVRFRKPVVPGDQLRIEANIVTFRRNMAKSEVKAYVGDDLACEAQLTFFAVDNSHI